MELLPFCQKYGVGVVPYSPLARGVLSGKYLPGEEPPKGSRAARKDRRILQTELREESYEVAQQLIPAGGGTQQNVDPIFIGVGVSESGD